MGGTMVSLTLNNKINAEELSAQFAAEGVKADVRVFETAVGYKAEIEFPQSKELLLADQLKTNFTNMLTRVSQLESLIHTNSSYLGEYNAKKAEIDSVANQMFKLAGEKNKSEDFASVNDIHKAFTKSYQNVYSNYESRISQPIKKHVNYTSISIQTVSPSLSTHFIESAIQVVLVSAVLSIAFVFFFFRTLVPSAAVIIGALADVVIAMGAMGLFGIPLTLSSFAALLMLIGFSLDTDILLTMRMLKRKGDSREKAHDAMKTGLTMSIAAIVSFGVLFALSVLTHIPTYYEISAVALAGLFGDMFATWGINAVMLLWYVEKKGL